MTAAASYKIAFSTPNEAGRVITCKSHLIERGEGNQGPFILRWWSNPNRDGEPDGAKSQVFDYEVNPQG